MKENYGGESILLTIWKISSQPESKFIVQGEYPICHADLLSIKDRQGTNARIHHNLAL